ncbi:MAG: type II toxin-antitoxin system PemK/MazF family toxin [Desulfobacterales bacterium]|jgi:mRNA interferase MazF
MKRGDVVLVVVPGDYGKPRPAVVVQTDLVNDIHSSIVVCPVTSRIQDAELFRLTIEPSPSNGLHKTSQIMVDKIVAVRRDKIRDSIGILDEELMIRLNRSLAFWLGLG